MGQFSVDRAGTQRLIPDYIVFHDRRANVPFPAHALWIYSQMVRWGQVELSAAMAQRAADAYRPDLYRAALGLPHDMIADAWAAGLDAGENFLDGHLFDPSDIAGYVAGFPIRSRHDVETLDEG
jgi:two-component system, oxyanion-binding sensor